MKILREILKSIYSTFHDLNLERKCHELNAYGFATLSVVNVRTEPRYQAEMAAQILMGTPVKVHYSPQGTYWMNIETPDGCRGWVNKLAIELSDEESLSEWKKSRRLIVISDYTRFLEDPSPEAQQILDGVAGDIILDTGEQSGQYHKVTVPDGRTAFVKNEDVSDFETWANDNYQKSVFAANGQMTAIAQVQSDIMATAKRFVGVPFLWRGASVKGFDCSGFVKYVYFLNGIILPYAVLPMSNVGQEVDIRNGNERLRPADLVFFGHEADSRHPMSIKHVAIYLGNGMIAHSSHFVRVNNVFDESRPDAYVRKIIAAHRIIGSNGCGLPAQSVWHSNTYFDC